MSLNAVFTGAQFGAALGEQTLLALLTFALATLIGVPLGILAYRYRALKTPLIGLVNLLQTLPAFAVFGLFVLLGHLRFGTALAAALLYSVLPVIFGTEKGLRRIGRPAIDAALGMGLSRRQVFTRVLLPLASPQVMVGLRKAAVASVGMITLATLRGGGLGELILDGIDAGSGALVAAGALPACAMALLADLLMALLSRRVVPAPLRRKERQALYIAK